MSKRAALAARFATNAGQQTQTLLQTQRYVKVVRSVGLLIETQAAKVALGSLCWLQVRNNEVACEIVGFDGERCYLMPLAIPGEIQPGTLVRLPNHELQTLPPNDQLIGRVVDGLGNPLDDRGDFGTRLPVAPPVTLNPMLRLPIAEQIDVGVRTINTLLSIGRGQRVGLFAGSGVGKSVLLGMLARFVQADVIVVGLIGERGREVREFVEDNLGSGLARSVVVACPADDSAALRLRGARLATQIAERFRDEGKHVLLLMDSLTRVAQAQREIGLALGEPPSTRGYTPSAFAALPTLVERAGTGADANSGSVTAFYTVLMEEDDLQDPVVDAARAILDGHIVLSRKLAESGIYPAIDIGASISRLLPRLTNSRQQALIQRFRQLWQTYHDQADLISIGAYVAGSDPLTDEAIRRYPAMCEFVRQSADEAVFAVDGMRALEELFAAPGGAANNVVSVAGAQSVE